MNKKETRNTKFIKIANIIDKASEKKKDICDFTKFCVFLFIYI